MSYKITGYFTHAIFESRDLKKNIYVLKITESKSKPFKVGGTVAVVTQFRQKITEDHVTVTGNLSHHVTYGFQIDAVSIRPTKNTDNTTAVITDNPPTMPQEYYDSMLIEYCHEQEKLYDFFTPEN